MLICLFSRGGRIDKGAPFIVKLSAIKIRNETSRKPVRIRRCLSATVIFTKGPMSVGAMPAAHIHSAAALRPGEGVPVGIELSR